MRVINAGPDHEVPRGVLGGSEISQMRERCEPAEYVVARDSPHENAVVVPWAEQRAHFAP